VTIAIRHGTVVDGTGADAVDADVLVVDGRVEAIGAVGPVAEEIDASGLCVAPGFIDIHSHSDYVLLIDPRAVSAIHQGVTTEVVGNCGHGCFPIADPALAARAIYGHSDALPVTWRTADGYFERLEEAAPAVNVLSLVPNGQLRLATIGLADRPAAPDELRRMERLLEEALDQGAWGYSTGLEYAQERGATEDELAALCAVAARHGALYATHTRRRDAGSAEAVEEAIRTSQKAGARLQVSHLIPRSGLEEGRRCVAAVDAAVDQDVDVEFDMHTRLYGTTFLQAALPPAVLAEPPERQARLLRERRTRDAVAAYESVLSAGHDWGRIVLLDNPVHPGYARRDIAAIAAERGEDPVDTVCELLAEAQPDAARLMVINLCHTEQQQREAFGHPLCIPGSDATTLAPDGPLAGSTFHGAYTWAAWYLRFTREERLLPLPEAVRRLTSAPAERLGLPDRGVLRRGAPADIVVFDADAVAERGTTFEPNQVAGGVRHVFVNGVSTLRDGALTGARAGEVIRRS
jgi:N-acyl-D-amino-acid deacylase